MNKRLNIGLIVPSADNENTAEIISGAVKSAEANNVNLFIIPVKYIRHDYRKKEDTTYHYQFTNLLEYITPKKYVKPKTFQLNPEQTLFINGFIRIDFVSGERSSFVGNFANNVLVHRTKLANADSFYDSHKDDVLLFPTKLERQKLGNFVTKKVNFTKEQKIDIAISGLGFLSVYGTGTLMVTYFNNVKVIVRKAMI